MTYTLKPDVRFRRILDKGLIVKQTAGEAIGVNRVGLRILELLAKGFEAPDLVATLAAEHGIGAKEIEADVAAFLDEMVAAGVLAATDGGPR